MKTEERQTTLEQVAPLLGHAYEEWKDWEGRKNDYKDAFFKLADEAVLRNGLGLKLYEVIADDEEVARKRALLHNPGWKVDELRRHRVIARVWEVILQEDPSFKSYSYEHEGIKYARQVAKGTVLIDDEYLAEEDSELYERATYALPWGERVVVPVQHLQREVLAQLQRYLYTDKPRVSLAKPRPVKSEE